MKKGIVLIIAFAMMAWGILAIMPSIWFTSIRYNLLLFAMFSIGTCAFETLIMMKTNLKSVWINTFILLITALTLAFLNTFVLLKLYLWSFFVMQMLITVICNCSNKKKKWYVCTGICLLLFMLYYWMRGTIYGYNEEISGGDMIPIAGLIYFLIRTNFDRLFEQLIPKALRLEEDEDEIVE